METTGKDIDDKKSDKFLIKKNILLENNSLNNYDKIKNFDNHSVKNSFKEINEKRAESLINLAKKYKIDSIKDENTEWIIDKIKLNDILNLLFYCCKRKKKNINKIVLNESMNIMAEKLDILNIFRNLCSFENINDNSNLVLITMSDRCSNELSNI